MTTETARSAPCVQKLEKETLGSFLRNLTMSAQPLLFVVPFALFSERYR